MRMAMATAMTFSTAPTAGNNTEDEYMADCDLEADNAAVDDDDDDDDDDGRC